MATQRTQRASQVSASRVRAQFSLKMTPSFADCAQASSMSSAVGAMMRVHAAEARHSSVMQRLFDAAMPVEAVQCGGAANRKKRAS